jgi:hypothetical protein
VVIKDAKDSLRQREGESETKGESKDDDEGGGGERGEGMEPYDGDIVGTDAREQVAEMGEEEGGGERQVRRHVLRL